MTATAPAGSTPGGARFERLDALRGAAVVWMAAFHFCFDLVYFGFIRQNFYTDPFWTVQRNCIVTLFLFCAGLGQAIATASKKAPGQPLFEPRFRRRWAQIAACAVLVSIGSWLLFPRSFISFGVLHCIALGLLLLRLTARAGAGWLWLAGGLALVAPLDFVAPLDAGSPIFDSRWGNWIGLVTHKPIAEDFVPLLPWLGVLWWGLAAGRWLLRHRPGWLRGRVPPMLEPLAHLGRWSLSFYMLHQPVFLGLLAALAWRRQ